MLLHQKCSAVRSGRFNPYRAKAAPRLAVNPEPSSHDSRKTPERVGYFHFAGSSAQAASCCEPRS
jgi:hypothetical protein